MLAHLRAANSFSVMRTLPLLACMGWLVTGCGSDGPSGPSIPNVAGFYQGTYTLTRSSDVGEQNLGPFPANATINQDETDLFVGISDPQGTASVTFTGTIAAGGAITLDDDPDLSTLEAIFPECSFVGAVPTNSASVAGGTLVATVDVVGASCPWVEAGGDFLPTSFEFRFEGS